MPIVISQEIWRAQVIYGSDIFSSTPPSSLAPFPCEPISPERFFTRHTPTRDQGHWVPSGSRVWFWSEVTGSSVAPFHASLRLVPSHGPCVTWGDIDLGIWPASFFCLHPIWWSVFMSSTDFATLYIGLEVLYVPTLSSVPIPRSVTWGYRTYPCLSSSFGPVIGLQVFCCCPDLL